MEAVPVKGERQPPPARKLGMDGFQQEKISAPALKGTVVKFQSLSQTSHGLTSSKIESYLKTGVHQSGVLMADINDFDLDFEGGVNLSNDSPSGAMANFHTGEHLKHEASCSCVPCTVEARKVHTGLADCVCRICNPADWSKDNLLKIKTNARNSYKFVVLPQAMSS